MKKKMVLIGGLYKVQKGQSCFWIRISTNILA